MQAGPGEHGIIRIALRGNPRVERGHERLIQGSRPGRPDDAGLGARPYLRAVRLAARSAFLNGFVSLGRSGAIPSTSA